MKYIRTGKFVGESGPLWFAFALLLFCLVLVAWRAVRPVDAAKMSPTSVGAAPSGRLLALFALALGGGSFLMRLVQPIGTDVLNMQFCFFVQYVALFAAGLHAARHGWLLPLAQSPQARRAGWLALTGGPVVLLAVLFAGIRGGARMEAFFGGWHWPALALALWEQCTGLGLSLGLLALFSSRMNRETTPLRWLADRCFAVYVLHAPVLVGLFMLYRTLPQNPYALAALLTVTGLLASFAIGDLARRVPGLRAIL